MPQVSVLDLSGSKVNDITLNEAVWGIEPNQQVLFDAIILARASLRQGTHKTKTRTEVRGGGRKPWRQKGTGRARQGSIRSPQWRGGGVVFGPTPRDYSMKMNRKQRRLALKSALSIKAAESNVIVVNEFNFESPKTKEFKSALSNLNVEGKTLVVTADRNEFVELSARNIPTVLTSTAAGINVLDLTHADKLIVTVSAVKAIEEVLA
jgi:large subunit ribosomal protein L4